MIDLSPSKLLRFLVTLSLALAGFSLAGQAYKHFGGRTTLFGFGVVKFFNVDSEQNLPTLFSVLILLLSAMLLWLIAAIKSKNALPYIRHWQALAVIFLCLSLDEGFVLHEKLIEPLRDTFNLSGIFKLAWVIPGAFFVMVFLQAYMGFVRALPNKTKGLFIKAFVLYIAGVLGMEMIGGAYLTWAGDAMWQDGEIIPGVGWLGMNYAIITTIEETLEMLAIVAFIRALLFHITHDLGGVKIEIDKEEKEEKYA